MHPQRCAPAAHAAAVPFASSPSSGRRRATPRGDRADVVAAAAASTVAAATAVAYKSAFRRRQESVSVRNSKQKSTMKPFVAVIGDCDLRASECGATGLGVGVD